MIRLIAFAAAALVLAGCDRSATVAPDTGAAAIAAAERKAVTDTDAALAEANSARAVAADQAQVTGTNGEGDRFPR